MALIDPSALPPGLAGFQMQQDRMRQQDMGQLQQVAQALQIRQAQQQMAEKQQAQQRQAAFQAEMQAAPDDATRQAIMRRYVGQTNPTKLFEMDLDDAHKKAQLAQADKLRTAQLEQSAMQFLMQMDARKDELEQRRDLALKSAADKNAQNAIMNEYRERQLVLEAQNKAFMQHLAQQNVDIKRLLAEKEKPITEFQGKNALYGSRAAMSDQILNNLEEKISLVGLSTKESLQNTPVIGGMLGAAANVALSPEQQKVEQAQRNFVNAVLRQESGAVISKEEFDNAKKQYFPQPGDKPEVIAQKRANRKAAIEGFRRIAGPAWASVEEQLRQATIPAAPAAAPAAPAAPKVIDFGSLK